MHVVVGYGLRLSMALRMMEFGDCAEIEGSVWITAMTQFVIDPEDPCTFGI